MDEVGARGAQLQRRDDGRNIHDDQFDVGRDARHVVDQRLRVDAHPLGGAGCRVRVERDAHQPISSR